MRLLLDTSVLIDVLRSQRGRRELLAELVRGGPSLVTTAVNVTEVFAGMRPEEQTQTLAFIDALDWLALASAGDHESGSDHQQDDTDSGRNFLALVGLNPNIDVARLDAMILGMWNRHEKRKDPQDHDRQPHYK